MGMRMNVRGKSGVLGFVSLFVTVHPHEISSLLHSAASFFFILSAYFVVLPLRDEGAISLGLSHLPSLFVGSLVLTFVAAPLSTLVFSYFSKPKALLYIIRFFSCSLLLFFFLWFLSAPGAALPNSKWFHSVPTTVREELKVEVTKDDPAYNAHWGHHGFFFVAVRVSLFLWVALLNLITISSTWARVIDVMDSDAGSRLFGFIGAGATFGQLFGSLFATGMAWLGPYLLLLAALLMEFAAQSSKGINEDVSGLPEELRPIRQSDIDQPTEAKEHSECTSRESTPPLPSLSAKPQLWAILDGLRLILSSTYLLHVASFLWLNAMISSFFYFQKVTIIATTVTNAEARRKLFAQINSFIAVFILAGQLSITGYILTIAGVTVAICAAPVVAFLNLIAIAVFPTWIVVAVSETVRKVITYVVTRPGRELLFTVVSQDEKYKAKVCIDVLVQRLGDATAAGMYQILLSRLNGRVSNASLYALPVCSVWMATAFYLGRRHTQLARLQQTHTYGNHYR